MPAVSSAFDGGNIRVVRADQAADIELEIVTDNESHFYQWFYFRVSGVAGQQCRMRIANAAKSAYPEGWDGYQAVASYNREDWFRVATSYDGEALIIEHHAELDAVYFAYFAPYSMERHADFVAHCLQSPLVQHEWLGHTLDQQDMDLLVIGEPAADKKRCWFIARQHPGESMAEWWMEGFVNALLDADNALARSLLEHVVFYVVPNMNPDGSRRGHLRTNAAGKNLNREWRDASMAHSPEVFLVREKMAAIGVDFALDVHGDEALPYNFVAGAENIVDWNEHMATRQQRFLDAYEQVNPDFQQQHGYPLDAPNSSDLRKATEYIAHTHQCLSMTLEMPFKDNADLPDPETGWSPERCRQLGAAVLYPLRAVLQDL
jgi:murein tripeptide amidase MpaA